MSRKVLLVLLVVIGILVIMFCYYVYPTKYKYEVRRKIICVPGKVYIDAEYGKNTLKRKYFRDLHKKTIDASFKIDRLSNETYQLENGRWILIGLKVPDEYQPIEAIAAIESESDNPILAAIANKCGYEYSDDMVNWDRSNVGK